MKALTPDEIAALLSREPGWKFAGGKLVREWVFADFLGAMAFVNEVARVAEEAGHHPDIDIRYNKVRLGMVTHDVCGVTTLDARMAEELGRRFPG